MKYLIYAILATIVFGAACYLGDMEHTKAYRTGFIVAVLLDLAWGLGKDFDKD
jgi:hypothetical protein